MILLFVIITILLQGYVMGCVAYCGARIYKLPYLHRPWRVYFSIPYFAFAGYLLVLLLTAPFAGRPASLVLWTAIARLVALVALGAAISLPTMFFFGWINGGYAKATDKK